jgi:hypothetical protein
VLKAINPGIADWRSGTLVEDAGLSGRQMQQCRRVHETFTQTGTVVAVPLEDPSLPSYTGKFTIWGGFNLNNQVVNGTFTFTVHATGSDGSTVKTHFTDHYNVRPNGTENFFSRCH